MRILPLHCLALLALVGDGNANCAEDASCLFHKDLSLIIKPPAPDDRGLTKWDKNYVTDDQSGPFYDAKRKAAAHVQAAPTDKEWIVLGLTVGLGIMVKLTSVLACLVSSRGASVCKMSWGLVSQAITVFCGFLIFMALKDLAKYAMASWTTLTYTLESSLILLALCIMVTNFLLFVFRSWPVTMIAIGTIGLYVVSFATIDACEFVERLSIFRKADLPVGAGIFISAVAAIVIFVNLSSYKRELLDWSLRKSERCRNLCRCCCCCFFDSDAVNAPAWNEWKKQAAKCEDQFAAVAIGYLFSQAVEYGILRALPTRSISFNFHVLLLATGSFVFLSLCIAVCSRGGSEAQLHRLRFAMLNSCSMTAAWCLFHAAQWQYNGGFAGTSLGLDASSFKASLLVALTLTLIALCSYVMMCLYSLSVHTTPWDDTVLANFQALVIALGFIIGMAWVTCLATGLPNLVHAFVPELSSLPTVPAAAAACVLVLPLWALCVLPRAIVGKTIEG